MIGDAEERKNMSGRNVASWWGAETGVRSCQIGKHESVLPRRLRIYRRNGFDGSLAVMQTLLVGPLAKLLEHGICRGITDMSQR
jgi:hypothetical protein